MRKLSLIISMVTMLIFAFTPSAFRSDYINLFDAVSIIILIANTLYAWRPGAIKSVYFLNSLFGLLSAVTTIRYDIEHENRFNRIYSIFSESWDGTLAGPMMEIIFQALFFTFLLLGLFMVVHLLRITFVTRNRSAGA